MRTVNGAGVSGVKEGDTYASKFINAFMIEINKKGDAIVFGNNQRTIKGWNSVNIDTVFAPCVAPVVLHSFGVGSAGYLDGDSSVTLFRYPEGVTVTLNDSILICDSANKCLRIVEGFPLFFFFYLQKPRWYS